MSAVIPASCGPWTPSWPEPEAIGAQAGHALANALAQLGVTTAPGLDLVHAGSWLDDQRADLRRRRADLLKTTPDQATPLTPETATSGQEADAPGREPARPAQEADAPGPQAARPAQEDVASPAQEVRSDSSLAEQAPFGRLAGAVNDVVAWAGSAWADQVGTAAGALGLPGVGEVARGYAEHGVIPSPRAPPRRPSGSPSSAGRRRSAA